MRRAARRVKMQMLASERRQHQEVPVCAAPRARQRLHRAIEVLRGLLAQPAQVELQMRRRRISGEIGVVDTCRQQLIDGEAHAPGTCFTPVIADGPGEVFGRREPPGAVAQGRILRDLACEPRHERQRAAPQGLGCGSRSAPRSKGTPLIWAAAARAAASSGVKSADAAPGNAAR